MTPNPELYSSGARRDPPGQPSSRTGLLAGLEVAIEEALPGLEICDQDLVIDGEVRAELVGVDPAGCLTLVVVLEGRGEEDVIRALEVLSRVRANVGLVARHLQQAQLDASLAPRVLVVADPMVDVVQRGLEGLGAAGLDLFRVRRVESAKGERNYLEPVGGSRDAAGEPTGGVEVFIATLPEGMRPLAERMIECMDRLDDDLVTAAGPRAVSWSLDGELVVRMDQAADGLQVAVGPRLVTRALAAEKDVDGVVEDALLLVLRSAGIAEEEGLVEHELKPADPEQLLTPEEIEAFRD